MNSQSPTHPAHLYRASWGLIAYTVLIIAWGAWVRISGSGDGCGEHWPLCNGQAVPSAANVKTWTEVSHRYSTALFGLLIIAQLVAVRRLLPASNPARFWVWLTLLFTLTEALIGRMLVVKGLVNESQAVSRMVVMPLHLVNTSLLLFSEVMTAESIAFGTRSRLSLSPTQRRWISSLIVLTLLLLCSGAIAALGSHLLPASSLGAGLAHDLSPTSHPAVRLRILHPILGVLGPLGCWLVYAHLTSKQPATALTTLYRQGVVAVLIMILLGVLTLALLAPTWLKLAHLTMANLLVIIGSRCIFHTLRPQSDESAQK